MAPDIATLPDDPAVLKQMLVDSHQSITDLQDRFDKETSILMEQIRLLRAQLYGRKSEKVIPQDGPRPLPLFDMPEPEGLEDEPEEKVHVSGHSRRKRGRKPLSDDLPRKEVIHDIEEKDKVCACGCELRRSGRRPRSSWTSSRQKSR